MKNNNQIPKVIHYCWFSGEEMPRSIKECMNSWRQKMPDYELRLWDANSFDFDSVPFVRDAYKERKWAFVTDYIRLYALYTEGGIYMDTDVKVFKSFNEFLHYNFFSSHEIHSGFYDTELSKLNQDYSPKDINDKIANFGIQAAIMAAVPQLPYIKDCLNQYQKMNFYTSDGKFNLESLIIGGYITREAYKYGYKFFDDDQLLKDNMMIKKSDIFAGNPACLSKNSYAIHLCNGSWRENISWQNKMRIYAPNLYRLMRRIVCFVKKSKN